MEILLNSLLKKKEELRMKKKIIGFVIVMMCAVCMGCSQKMAKVEHDTGSILDLQKSQEVIICDAEEKQLADLTDAKQIENFVNKLDVDKWKISEVGDDAVLLWQIQMYYDKAQNKKAELKVYENQYAEFSMGKQSFDFQIPQEVQDAIKNLQK